MLRSAWPPCASPAAWGWRSSWSGPVGQGLVKPRLPSRLIGSKFGKGGIPNLVTCRYPSEDERNAASPQAPALVGLVLARQGPRRRDAAGGGPALQPGLDPSIAGRNGERPAHRSTLPPAGPRDHVCPARHAQRRERGPWLPADR